MIRNLCKLLGSRRSGRHDTKHRPRSLRFALEHLEDRLVPATVLVTDLSDSASAPARGTELRQAITTADGTSGDVINFTVNGVIVLQQGELNVTSPMTIDGTTHSIAIDAGARSRVFFINTPGTVTINNLTIKNGNSATTLTGNSLGGNGNGGGIYDANPNSILNGTGDTIEGNTATNPSTGTKGAGGNGGGVYSNGVVNFSSSFIESNSASQGFGGGIYAAKNITLTGTLVSNNTAAQGGGIYQAGTGTTVTLNTSTVTTNKATGGSGTGTVPGNGGGVYAFFNFVGNSSTVSNNQAMNGGNGGGVYSATGNITDPGVVSGNTAFGNGGGLWANFNIILTGATVSNNISDGNVANGGGGGGLFSNVGFIKLFSGTSVTGNQAFGGTSTTTGAGNGGGAWSGTDFTEDATSSVTNNTANGNGGGIYALRNVVINGGTVSNNTAVSTNFNSNGAAVDGNGGGIWSGLDTTLNGGLVSGNNAGLNGGGIYINNLLPLESGNLDINSGAVVSGNTAGFQGGGAWVTGGNVSVVNSSITGNSADDDGGGLFVSGNSTFGSLVITNSLINSNHSILNSGGGVFVSLIDAVTITNSTFDSNTAPLNGGGIASVGVLNEAITGTTFTNNVSASGLGGALYVIGPSDLYLLNDSFGVDGSSANGNSAGLAGGAVYLGSPAGTQLSAVIYGCFFDGNVSYGGPHSGSDLFVDKNVVVDLNLTDFDDDGFLSAALATDLIDTNVQGLTFVSSGGVNGVINSSGGNAVWDNSWVAITGFGFPGSGDLPDDQA